MLKIVDRLLLSEMISPFLFGVGLFSLLTIATVVMNDALKFLTRYDLPPEAFFLLVGLAAPQFIVLSLPMGALLGTLLAVGRLSSDQEIIALRACGISLYRVLAPFVIFGILLSGITFLGNELVVPYCNTQLSEFKNNAITGEGGSAHRQRMTWPIYDHGQLRWVLIAGQVQGSTLDDVLLLYFDPVDKYSNFMTEAERATWDGNAWSFVNSRSVKLHASESGDQQLIMESSGADIPGFSIVPKSLARRKLEANDLTIRQLRQVMRDKMRDEGFQPQDTEIRQLSTTLHFKTSIPLTPLFFILIALPLAIMPQRSSKTTGAGLSLLVVVVYYAMFVVFQKLGTAGVLAPVAAAWVPNALLLLIGGIMMQRRERT